MTQLEQSLLALQKAMQETAAEGYAVKLEPSGKTLYAQKLPRKELQVRQVIANSCMHRGSACELCAICDCPLRTAAYK
jgi:hypothetical protein